MDNEFKQHGIETNQGKTLEDFFQIKGSVLNLIGTLQTINFLSGKKGVQIDPSGLTASGGSVNGAVVNNSNVYSVSVGGTGASSFTSGGILKGNGTGAIQTIAGVSGSFYVASSSGGSPTHLVTVTNGVITAIA